MEQSVNRQAFIKRKDFSATEKILRYRKERHFYRQFSMIEVIDGEPIQVMRVNFYSRTRGIVYCAFWLNHGVTGTYVSGAASCKLYGMDAEATAFQLALLSADVYLSWSIGGTGDTGIRDAMAAIGRCLGIDSPSIFVHHG